MEKFFSISQTAKIAEVTAETLRHYDRINLVKPCKVDEWTGYRYYSMQEIVILNTIKSLRCMDLFLSEIKEILSYNDFDKIVAALKKAEANADKKIAELNSAKAKITRARRTFTTADVEEYLRSVIVMGMSDALASSGIGVADMSSNLIELSATVQKLLLSRFKALGMELTAFNLESLSLPPEVERAIDENARLGVLKNNVDVYTRIAQADALMEAAKNPGGGAGGLVGAGVGLGIGADLARSMGETVNGATQSKCPVCGAAMPSSARFCPECGTSVKRACPKCGAPISPGAKFCPECGAKV